VHSAIEHLLDQIAEGVERVLAQVPPDRRAPMNHNGLVLTGGGAQLNGLVEFLSQHTHLAARVARDPQACVAVGTGMALENLQVIRRGQHYIT
jgi:rod shape-determining protein MreB